MGTAKLMHIEDRLSRLLEQCEILPNKLNRRQAILSEMESLGRRIDAAYRLFTKSPRAQSDQDLLNRTQTETQAQIEQLRGEADGIMTQWWDVYRAVGADLVEAARQAPALLPVVESFNQFPMPSNSNPKLQVLRLQELLRSARQLLAPAEPPLAPRESKEVHTPGGLQTAKEIAAALGISDKTIYRLAKQGLIPYVRVHSSLRFCQSDIEAWVALKSFQPSGMKKATSGKKDVRGASSNR